MDRQDAARIDRFAIEQHGAGSARAAIAHAFASGNVEIITQGIEQRHARFERGVERLAVNA